MSEFQRDCLKAHNDYRSKHKVAPLKLSKELCSHAQEWAEVSIKLNKVKLNFRKKF